MASQSVRPSSTVPPIERVALERRIFGDLYHFFLKTSWPRMIGIVLALYLAANACFALLYVLGGDCIEHARPGSFEDDFFFSVQTMATIGYGGMAPKTRYA